jgi:biotin transport system substrate-specific component
VATIESGLERYRTVRDDVWQWIRGIGRVKKLGLALGMACLIGLMAQVRIPLPWTPVPITGQTFAVLLAAVLLGEWWGGACLIIYVGLGILGVPWFNGGTRGMVIVAGPTGGYIIGFILAALLVGYVTKKHSVNKFFLLCGLMLLADFGIIFGFGLLQLHIWLGLNGKPVGLDQLLTMGLLPFVAGDILKVIAAAGASKTLLPGKDSDK